MGTKPVVRIQDSVHGLMEFRGLETFLVEVLRTPEVQRLRRVKQLGLAHFVFPGAEHSRFSHCLGAAHLALRFGHQIREEARALFSRALVPDEHALTDLALGALCHDLGHGPLSHAWEREIVGEEFDHSAWARSFGLDPEERFVKEAKWHELIGQGLLAWPDGQLHRLLEFHERGTPERIRKLLAGQYYFAYLPRLLNSDVDVDRADFIRRDTLHSGVAYGRFDLDWLISTCTLGQEEQGNRWVVGFDARKGLRVIEQLLIARQALYSTVYHHKTVRCMEGMVAQLLKRLKNLVATGREEKVPESLLPTIRVMKGETLGPEDVLGLDDCSVMGLVDGVARGRLFVDDTARDLAARIQSRDLFKEVVIAPERLRAFFSTGEGAEKVQGVLRRFVGGEPSYYYFMDQTQFDMLSKKPETQAMLIQEGRVAQRAGDHEALVMYRRPDVARPRLFAVRQAVEALRRLVGGGA